MNGEALGRGAVVLRGADGLGADERAVLRQPERHLAPPASPQHRQDLEGRAGWSDERNVEVRHAELVRDAPAVSRVPVEQLQDARRLTEGADSLEHTVVEHRIDQPDPSARDERMRAALHEVRLGRDPAEPELELVDETRLHLRGRYPCGTASRVESTVSASPYSTASAGPRKLSRSMSRMTSSTSRPEWNAISSA